MKDQAMTTLRAEWEMFERNGIPKTTPATVHDAMRYAFYVGALSITGIMLSLSRNSLTAEEKTDVITAVMTELRTFSGKGDEEDDQQSFTQDRQGRT